MLHPRSLRALRLVPLLLAGCRGYYPTWHYVPGVEIHQLHVGGEQGKPAPATISVAARLVGILRPAGGAPRRLHAELELENRGERPASFDPAKVKAKPSGSAALAAEGGGAVAIAAGERRRFAVYFPIPSPQELPNASLEEIDLEWTVDVEGRALTTHAVFRRGSIWYDDPYYYRPYYGPYYGPYWGHGPYYDPWWHVHGSFAFVHCD
jgi:hypothetical protein